MKKIIISTALLLCSAALFAQNDNTYNESVVVKGSYTPVIDQAEKLNFPAQITDTLSRIEHTYHYTITPTRLRAMYEPTRIRAARIIGEPATKLYNNYLRLGFGNYWSPLADLYWSSTRDRLKTYGVRINHFSSWDKFSKLPEYGPVQQGNTGVTLFGKYIVGDVLQLSSDLSYEHDHNLYYGFTDNTLQNVLGLTRDDISLADYRASYNVATWNVGIKNMELDANKLGYAVNVHLADLWSIWNQNELNLNLSGDVHYGFNIAHKYKGIAYLHAEWDAYRYEMSSDNLPLGRNNTPFLFNPNYVGNLVQVNPFAVFFFRGLDIHAGVTMGWDGLMNNPGTVFHFFPDVVVSKKLMKGNLVLSLAATGGMEANSLNSIRQINPYVMPEISQWGSTAATSHYDFVGHARWTLSKKLEANAEVSYSLRENDITFTLSPYYDLDNVYQVAYNSLNRLTVGGDITFVNDEMITLRAGGHYYHYNFTEIGAIQPVWSMYYRPDWDALVSAKVNYHNKWFFYLEGQLLGKMEADGGQTLPMRYGINAEVEYRHNRALSFFAKMDNLAFQRYWYWANYPSQRGLFLAGLTYTIPHK
ncbi:MAG: hypothetical protein J6X79_04770 [Bacteroidales bacterium]|nr:hypothetical protein [Bacteroidales bacterium]